MPESMHEEIANQDNYALPAMQPVNRHKVYQEFKQFKRSKDSRSMLAICKSGSPQFELQVQQEFLKAYVQKYPNWKKLVLYHQIGSGKTCTAITIAEEYIKMHPNNKVTIILPARLRTNFLDELLSPCGMQQYISKDDHIAYFSDETKPSLKKAIKQQFMNNIENKYEIISFEQFRSIAETFGTSDLKGWMQEFTNNRLIIVDEVHNMLSSSFKRSDYELVLNSNSLLQPSKIAAINTILFLLMNRYANSSSKMLYLTATPLFDNIKQLRLFVNMLKPDQEIAQNASIKEQIEHLRGMISYFPGTSKKAYPTSQVIQYSIPITSLQETQLNLFDVWDFAQSDEEISNAFLIHDRQQELICVPIGWNLESLDDYELLYKRRKLVAPKIVNAIANIKRFPGKHVVYSTFIHKGLSFVEFILQKQGWINILDVLNDRQLWARKKQKVYAVWDGLTTDTEKQQIKSIMNNIDNINGDRCRVLLGSPSMKEGVSFKHVQHLHVLDPVWNQSSLSQLYGRVIRYCSHVDIPSKDPVLQRKVDIHTYITKNNSTTEQKTADEIIYDIIIPRKAKQIKIAEDALKKVSIDYFLFRDLYMRRSNTSPAVSFDSKHHSKLHI